MAGTTTKKLLSLIAFAKSLDPTTLKDIEDIESVTDGHTRAGVPTPAEVPGGPAQAMRGGQAGTQIDAHSEIKPGDRATQDYAEVSNRMGAMEKAVAAMTPLVAGFAKAMAELAKADEVEEGETDKDVEKALRKARISIQKAEDADEDEEVVEKADAALVAAATAVSKAEDEAEDDKGEEFAAKARTTLKSLRGRLVAAKAARTPAPAVQAPAAPPATQKSEDDAMALVASKSGISVEQLLHRISGGSVAAEPPVFAKSLLASGPAGILEKAEQMNDEGVLTDLELSKAQSLVGRLRAVQAGQYDTVRFTNEVIGSSDNVKRLLGAA